MASKTNMVRTIYSITIYLESLSLFAIYLNKQSTDDTISKYFFQKKLLLSIFSGIFLGISIFTKLSAFTFIPLEFSLIFSTDKKNLKYLAIWSIPVILIPLIWPANAIYLGELDEWFKGLLWQSERFKRRYIRNIPKIIYD